MLFFLSPQLCCFRNSEFSNTLVYQNEGRENTVTRTSTYLSFKFVLETIRYYYLLYACEVIYLFNKSLISMYVQEQGGILLKFNILRLHYVRHHCARIKCQPFWSSPEVIQEARFAQYGKIILKPLKNCFIWLNLVAVFTVISWNHYNIHELLHQALIVMKITVHPFL